MNEFTMEAQIEPVWGTIRSIRAEIKARLDGHAEGIRNAAGMVASELLENAMKYGETAPTASTIKFEFSVTSELLRLAVTNGIGSSTDLERLTSRIAEVNSAEDKAKPYMRRLEQLLEQPAERSGLGIYRIGFEGKFGLKCSARDGAVTVVATRNTK
jgi:hypothetical protein